jgi:serine/threonine protein kinase/formylglycine-generating enzyme required for sulfatase activity
MSSGDSVFDAFLAALWRDFDAGRLRPLSEYLAAFPGRDADVAREYAAMSAGGPATWRSPDGERGRGDGGGSGARPATPWGAPSTACAASGPRLGPYLLGEELGRGGFGEVYRAEDVRIGRRVALKVLTRGHSLDDLALERFRREAQILSKLDHPGICTVFEAGQDRGTPYLAMKLVPGETLAKKLAAARERLTPEESGTLRLEFESDADAPPPEAKLAADRSDSTPATEVDVGRVVRLIEQAARALHVAHEAGVVHRDVKPGNIMVTPDGAPVVLDFGLAYDAEADGPTLSRTGDLMGTPAYMSPEQIAARRIRVDRRTDVFSLGVTLFECLSLRRPFESPTREGLLQAIMTQAPPDLRRLNAAVPRDLHVVAATALEKDRDRRYATALDFADDLRRVRRREPIRARPPGPWTKLVRFTQRNPALAAALFALFAVLAAGLGVALTLLGQKEAALAQVTNERNGKTAALEDYDRLGDRSRLARLRRESEALWPAEPGIADELRSWLEEAERTAARSATHEASLAAWRRAADGEDAAAASRSASRLRAVEAEREQLLRDRKKFAAAAALSRRLGADAAEAEPVNESLARALRRLDEEAALEARPRFRDPAMQFRFDSVADLCAELRRFADPDPFRGEMASVRRRLRFAETVAARTIEGERAARWEAATRAIGDQQGKYGGLRLAPQLGLIPLGPDPVSGWWEFVDVATTADDADPIPRRKEDGRWDVRPETGLIFVLLPGGKFFQGARRPDAAEAARGAPYPPNVDPYAAGDEAPVHATTLDPFFLSKYEMTQAQWLRVAGENPSHFHPGVRWGDRPVDLRHPVESVTWFECERRLAEIGCVLPTEAQWEFGARGGTRSPFWSGDERSSLAPGANLADEYGKAHGGGADVAIEPWDDGYAVHAPVGTYRPNGFGLHDTAGNVYEWCRDGMFPYLAFAPRAGDGFRGPSHPPLRASRGGSFYYLAVNARSADRADDTPDTRNDDLGLRPARALRRP